MAHFSISSVARRASGNMVMSELRPSAAVPDDPASPFLDKPQVLAKEVEEGERVARVGPKPPREIEPAFGAGIGFVACCAKGPNGSIHPCSVAR